MKENFKRGIFIVGVRKCGTTTLFDILSQHSKIQAGKLKEPQFFCLPRQTVRENIGWYTSLFPGDASRILDGSAFYYQLPGSLGLIREYFQQPYFILCLRDPAKRFFSAYWHMRGKPQGVEKRSLREIIDGLTGSNTEDILERERQFIARSANQGKVGLHYQDAAYHQRVMGAPFSSEGLPPELPFEYFKESVYSLQYPEFAASGRTQVVLLEQLIQEPERVLNRLHEFLGLDPEPATLQLAGNRNSGENASSASVLQGFSGNPLYGMLKKVAGQGIRSRVRKYFSKPIPRLQPQEYALLRGLLREEYDFWLQQYPEWEAYWREPSRELRYSSEQ